MTIEDLHRVQQIDTELLVEVDRICNKYDIRYFLFYGTLLGAVRHAGPIPWDDDVDICMTRPNYYRFIDACRTELNHDKYLLKIMGSGSSKYISEIKIGKKNTVYCLPGTETFDIMNMVQLDVFLLDYIKPMTKEQYLSLRKIWIILRLCKLNWSEKKLLMKFHTYKNKRSNFLYKIALSIMHVPRLLFGELLFERIGYNIFVDQTGMSTIMSPVGTMSYLNKEYFADIAFLPYLDHFFPVPAAYDRVLNDIYGEYAKLPPEDKRFRELFSEWVFKEL